MYRKQASLNHLPFMSKREYNISQKCWGENFPLAGVYSNNGLKYPVSERIVFFTFFWTVWRPVHFHLKRRVKFWPSWIILYRKRRISTAEKFYAAVIRICSKHAIFEPIARPRFLWVATEENSEFQQRRGLLIFSWIAKYEIVWCKHLKCQWQTHLWS